MYFFLTFCQTHPYAIGLKNKLFPYFDDFVIIFGKDRATGEGAETATDAVKVEEDNDEDEQFVDATKNYHEEP